MPNTKPFRHLTDGWTAERRARVAELKKGYREEMKLFEIREKLDMTQERLAGLLNTSQANVSRFESQADMLLSTLRNYVRAIGGELELCVRFPETTVYLKGLGDLRASRK